MNSANVSIRALQQQDLKARVRWLNDESVTEHLRLDNVTSESTSLWFERASRSDKRVDLTLIDESATPIGAGGFLSIEDHSAELYFWLGESSLWGQGLGREGWRLTTRYGFDRLGLARIWARTRDSNTGAQAILRSLDYQEFSPERAAGESDSLFFELHAREYRER